MREGTLNGPPELPTLYRYLMLDIFLLFFIFHFIFVSY